MTTSKIKTVTQSDNSTATSDLAPISFEQAYAELEKIVANMESGQMTLEASLTAFQHGNSLLQLCQKTLADVEQKVQILNARNLLTPFQPDDE